MSLGKRVTSLDPVLAADTTSQYVIGAFYDTPLQYSYRSGLYRLEPSMLQSMPEVSPDQMEIRCTLRDDLFFQDGPPFANGSTQERRITAQDVVFSLLRLADARLHSSGYWLVRGKLKGLDQFRELTSKTKKGDLSPYDIPVPGITAENENTFVIRLTAPDPRFLYALALPYCSVVSRKAVVYYGDQFADQPLGSGPFRLAEWNKDYRLRMTRNPEFRKEYLPTAEVAADRVRPLPLSDEIDCYLVKQPLASWLMFLQGELDFFALEGEHFEAVVNEDRQVAPTLLKRGIRLLQAPAMETNYIGFNFADPILGNNENLRKAISLAFDKHARVLHSGGRFTPAYGPVPPGVDGAIRDGTGPYGELALEKAKAFLRLAGYPDGIDPATGQPLELSFDQPGSDTVYRQTAELMVADMQKIGIRILPGLNTRPRFLQKLSAGQMQLFRFSWTADYPDAENFLQLFYGPNGGSCNRALYSDPEYDRMFREIISMPDSPERTAKYETMSRYLMQKCPWIFETHTMTFLLVHSWMTNYIPHDFAFNRWKYFSVDGERRNEVRASFTPISMNELRK